VQPWRCGRSRPPPAIWARAWQLAADLARAEADKHRASAAPRLDLVAQAEQQRLSGSGDYGSGARNRQTNALLGVQFTVPLYTGGWRSAKEEESLALQRSPGAAGRHARTVARQVHAAWLGLQAGAEQVRALQQARLPATPGRTPRGPATRSASARCSTCCTPTTTAPPPRWPWPRRAAGL
jgi:outer membrane protein